MPLVQKRDPGGWMTRPSPAVVGTTGPPVLTAHNEPLRAPAIAPTGAPSMEYSRVALIGMS